MMSLWARLRRAYRDWARETADVRWFKKCLARPAERTRADNRCSPTAKLLMTLLEDFLGSDRTEARILAQGDSFLFDLKPGLPMPRCTLEWVYCSWRPILEATAGRVADKDGFREYRITMATSGAHAPIFVREPAPAELENPTAWEKLPGRTEEPLLVFAKSPLP